MLMVGGTQHLDKKTAWCGMGMGNFANVSFLFFIWKEVRIAIRLSHNIGAYSFSLIVYLHSKFVSLGGQPRELLSSGTENTIKSHLHGLISSRNGQRHPIIADPVIFSTLRLPLGRWVYIRNVKTPWTRLQDLKVKKDHQDEQCPFFLPWSCPTSTAWSSYIHLPWTRSFKDCRL